MLVRSAGRRQRRQTARVLDACFAQLSLPWLAPAQLRWRSSHASVLSPAQTSSRRRSLSQRDHQQAQSRHLATAIEQSTSRTSGQYDTAPYNDAFKNESQDRNIPWDPSQRLKPKFSTIRPYNDPIIINTSVANPTQIVKVSHGLQGTAIDLVQHLHTALQVGRLSRAEAIIRRLGDLCSPDSSEILHAHTAYLEESLRAVALNGRGEQGQKTLEEMQRWFEVEMRQNGVALDAKVLVVMIRASIRALDKAKRARTLRRYVELARELGDDVHDDVMESEDYDDNEYTILGRLTYDESEQLQKIEDGPPSVSMETTAPPVRSAYLPIEEVPEVLPTEQRGQGLNTIKRAMNEFVKYPSLPRDMPTDQQLQQDLKRQKTMEETSVELAVDRWRKADGELRKIGIHTSMQSKPIGALMWQWYQALEPALKAEMLECKRLLSDPGPRDHDRYHYGPYLELLPLDKIAANTILFAMMKMASKHHDREGQRNNAEMKLASLTTGLADAIEQECKVNVKKSKWSHRQSKGHNGHLKQSLGRHVRADKDKKAGKSSKAERRKQEMLAQLHWPVDAKVKFGAMLISKLMETAQLPVTRTHPRTNKKVTQMQPAFLHRFKYQSGKKIGMFAANPALIEKIESEPLGSLIAKRMPMVVEPQAWSSYHKGGYLHYSNPILRLPVGDQSGKDYFLAAYNRGDMGQIFAGLTALGEVPWRIHHGVFKTQLEAWNSGEGIADFAPLHPKLDNWTRASRLRRSTCEAQMVD